MIKLIQLNLEVDKHLDKIIPFLHRESADVLCLQELAEPTFRHLMNESGMTGHFAPMGYMDGVLFGIGLLTKLPVSKLHHEYYWKSEGVLYSESSGGTYDLEGPARAIILGELSKDGEVYTVATTHFAKNEEGHTVAPFQLRDFENLKKLLSPHSSLILTGDSNCPRGTYIFDELAKIYIDNIPKDITTTLDKDIHRAGYLPFVVDILFTTSDYKLENIRLMNGVSDHLAVVAEISK